MADTVGALMVEAGIDLAGFESSVKQIPAITSRHMERMSAEMKRTTREGAESLRLIDEALGIHMSRPLARIIAQIPGVGSALQSILGVGAFGALAVVGVEFFDKITKGIERAEKAQEELRQSTEKVQSTYDAAMASYEKSTKLRSLSGLDKKLFEIDYSSIEEGSKKVKELSAAAEKNAKAAADASKWWMVAAAAVGTFFHEMTTSNSGLTVERMQKEFSTLAESIEKLSAIDALAGSHAGLEFAEEKLQNIEDRIKAVRAEAAAQPYMDYSGGDQGVLITPPDRSQELAELERERGVAQQIVDIQRAGAHDQSGAENAAKAADAMERQLKATSALAALQREISGDLGKFMPQTDPVAKMETEIVAMEQKLHNTLAEMREAGATPIQIRFATAQMDEAIAKLRAYQALHKQALADQEAFDQRILGNQLAASGAKAPDLAAPTTNLPRFTGDIQQQQLDKLASDADAKWDVVSKAEEAAITPLQKYAEAVARLNIAFQGISDPALLAVKVDALNKAWDEYTKSTQKAESQSLKLEKQLEQLEKQSDSAAAGVKAAITQLELSSATGKFSSAFTTEAISGFEDNTIRMMEGLKVKWSEYFRSLETMALKFAMNKAITGTLSSTGLGAKLGIGQNPAQAQGAAMAAQLTANTSVTTANTAAITANTAALSSAGAGGAVESAGGGGDEDGGGGGGFLAAIMGGLTPHAAGGDVSPGQGYLVGEQGPEPFFPGVSGSILPNSSLKGGGDTHIHNYDFSNFKGDAALMDAVKSMVEQRGQKAEQRAVIQSNERSLRTTTRS